MKYRLLDLLRSLEAKGGLVLSKDVDLRGLCEDCLSTQSERLGRGRGRPRKEVEESSITRENVGNIGRLIAEVSREEEEEESIKVKKITIEGSNYLISEKNIIYCPESHEEIGSYINNKLVLCDGQ